MPWTLRKAGPASAWRPTRTSRPYATCGSPSGRPCWPTAGHAPHRPVTPLGSTLAAAPLIVAISAGDGSASLRPAADPAPLVSRVAAAVAEALTAGTWQRLKACEAPDCHWAYYDRSPAGRGRWCSMQVCGARAKMRRYRAK